MILLFIKYLKMSKADGPEFFFGYLGVSCALVFASNLINIESYYTNNRYN